MKALIIDIDGLRSDVFSRALAEDRLPNITRFLRGSRNNKEVQIPALAPVPSVTFSSQASLFTGFHPSQHCIPGNQFFDRFGVHSENHPRFYAFDVGDTLEIDDAVSVFTKELASNCLEVPTIYDRFSDLGWRSVVAGNMFAGGAEYWLKPSLIKLARFTKGGNLFGMSSEDFDDYIMKLTLDHLDAHGLPDILTVYLMGLDHISHLNGPDIQMDYLCTVIDPLIRDLGNGIKHINPNVSPIISIVSDHGQIKVEPDEDKSLRLAVPFERELGHFFDNLGLDVHDYPGEDTSCDAVAALNGGIAFVYLRNRSGSWREPPMFSRDIQPVAKAFWEAHKTGCFSPELEGALAGVFVRNVELSGWDAPFLALTPDNEFLSLEDWFCDGIHQGYTSLSPPLSDPINRINNLVSPFVGDILLLCNYAGGYYFGAPTIGVHGGLQPEESKTTMVFGFPFNHDMSSNNIRVGVIDEISSRCKAESNRQPSTADLLTGLLFLLK